MPALHCRKEPIDQINFYQMRRNQFNVLSESIFMLHVSQIFTYFLFSSVWLSAIIYIFCYHEKYFFSFISFKCFLGKFLKMFDHRYFFIFKQKLIFKISIFNTNEHLDAISFFSVSFWVFTR